MGFSKRDDGSSEGSGSDVFRSVPKNRTTFLVWKIEGLQAITVPRNKIGYFLSESAYIVYAVSPKDDGLPYPGMPYKELKSNNIVKTIHFWIGGSCDSSISSAAALRAAELDSQINATILLRESEGRESPRFLAYFRQELIIERAHFDPPQVRLHRVTGRSIPISTELDSICWNNFSSSDVMLIDTQSRGVVFLWLGSGSSSLHRRHAMKLLEVRKDNNNIRIVIVDDGYEQTLKSDDKKLFDSILDPRSRSVIPQQHERVHIPTPIKLYRCSEQSGKYKVAEIKSGPIFRDDLTSSSVFLFDRGEAGVWAWVGKEVDAREKLEAVRNARGFIKKKGYSLCVPVGRAVENEEPGEMKTLLRAWEPTKMRPLILQSSFEAEYMSERPKIAAEYQLVDDGSSKRTLWRVSKKEGMIEVNDKTESNQGIFYAGVCYVMRYIYGSGRRERSIIYCWEGAHSTSLDREAALDAACKLAEDTSGQLVKASQGREPYHLLQIYGGKLRILAGTYQETPPKKYLVRVFGSTPYTSKAIERPLQASSLDSGGVFILFSDQPIVWCGGKSTGDAREVSRRLAPATAPLIAEGKEGEEFWNQLGGKKKYGTEVDEIIEESGKHLYHCNVLDKVFVGEEILGFTQNSLIPEAVWLLDAGNIIWVWLGKLAATKNLKQCVQDALVFLYTHPAARDRNTIISVVKQGLEPVTFIGLFENWNHNHWRDYRSFDEIRTALQGFQEYSISRHENPASNFDSYVKYPLKVLKSEAEQLPKDVDVFKKEMHLTYDDFMAIFKMNPMEFEKLPEWRRQRLKQSAGLF
ncbi:villin-1 isoform X2 [Chelonus insularis]|uniref:villin-1 isoform X2 n=1 Tax=Chelonus insularis TaxID=460826 RepID=UPI00158906CE|nr:villin-1 isoform X2 [Chelonus insularis]